MSLRSRLAALALAALSPAAMAFPILSAPPPATVVEYFNERTGHYFYTISASDQAALESGVFGAGWVRTGQGFGAYATRGLQPGWAVDPCAAPADCRPVTRFYAPGPNSHFFTGSASDVAILDRPGTGWFLESVAFYTRMPDASLGCAGATPVYRLYNNRAAQNDSNHRFTADQTARIVMLQRGWADEGIAFCAYGKSAVPVETHIFEMGTLSDVMDMRDCRAGSGAGSCLGVSNLPVPSNAFTSTSTVTERDEFDRQTGMAPGVRPLVNLAVLGGPRAAAAENAFVQLWPSPSPGLIRPATGIHLAPQSRGASPYASITALHRLPRARVYPYRFDTGTERELFLLASLRIQKAAAPFGSHAYGVFTLQFTDDTSGRSLLFNILAYGTAPAGEGLGRDANTGLPLVYATAGTDGRFGRLWGGPPSAIPGQANPLVGVYQAWIGRQHFLAILDAARLVDPLLSPRPGDYSVASFGLVNETVGDGGRVGVVIDTISLSVKGAP